MPSLFDIEGDMAALMAMLEDESGVDEDGEIHPQLLKWLEESEGQFERKVENYCSLIGELKAVADARKSEANRIRELQALAENKADRMKKTLFEVFKRMKIEKCETTRYKLRVQNAGGYLPLIVDEFQAIPQEFQKVTVQADRDAIRAALDSGKELPFAKLGERSKVLIIK